jgi:thiamine-phosphate pyrophosphorylase
LLLYYITDRRQFAGNEHQQRESLLRKISEAAHGGVDYIQLREKDLSSRELLALAQEAAAAVHSASEHRDALTGEAASHSPKLLVNSRIDIALAASADGVHLTSTDISARDARAAWSAAARRSQLAPGTPEIGVSCHTLNEVRFAQANGADFAVFAPVFEKTAAKLPGVGIEALRTACAAVRMPVFALGGVTLENAADCVKAGAAGIAAIRLFQENDIAGIVAVLRK